MEKVAQGRVWTGKDAASRGLVDAIGGFSRAVAIAKQKANIPQDKQVCFFTNPSDIWCFLNLEFRSSILKQVEFRPTITRHR